MSSQRRFDWPTPGSPDYAPALACVALVLALGLQLALPLKTELPDDPGLAPRRAREPAVGPIAPYPALLDQDVFSPDRAAAAAGLGAATASSIDQCAAIGMIKVGSAFAVSILPPGGSARLVRAGQTACGWRLSGAQGDKVLFVHGGETRRLVIGAAPVASTQPTAPPPQTPQGAGTSPQAPQGAETSQ